VVAGDSPAKISTGERVWPLSTIASSDRWANGSGRLAGEGARATPEKPI